MNRRVGIEIWDKIRTNIPYAISDGISKTIDCKVWHEIQEGISHKSSLKIYKK